MTLLSSQKHLPKLCIAVLFGFVLNACTTTSKPQTSNPQIEPTPVAAVAADLPGVELTQGLLEQLLTLSFAPYSGELDTSAESAFVAAQTSRDYRLASFAAITALRIKDYDLARKSADLWAELQPQSEGPQRTLIFAYLGLGNAEQAYQLLTQSTADMPLDEQIEVAIQTLSGQRNGQTAIDVIEKYTLAHPESADVLLAAAFVSEGFGQFDKAESWLSQALVLRPEWDKAAELKATVLGRQNKNTERAEFIQQFIQRNPKSVNMRINHAAELARADKIEQALTLMQEVIADDKKNVPALNYAAALAEHLDDKGLARKLYQRVVNIEPQNDEVHWSLARMDIGEEDYASAEQHYQQITGRRLFFRAQLQIANMRYQNQGLRTAIKTLRELQPGTEQEYVDLATTRHYLLMQEHQHEEAFAAINETLVFIPDNLDLRYARSLVAAELREVDTAEADLRFVLEQQPEHADALNALGYTLADQTERLDEAKELVEQALKLKPDAAHILDSMGWVLYRMGELKDAADYLEQAYDKAPQAEIAAHLGEVYWEMGDQPKARQIWDKGVNDDADNPVLIATLERYGVKNNESAPLSLLRD